MKNYIKKDTTDPLYLVTYYSNERGEVTAEVRDRDGYHIYDSPYFQLIEDAETDAEEFISDIPAPEYPQYKI